MTRKAVFIISTVLVVGAFDLLQAGQARFLAEARALADELAVGVASDESRQRLKGVGHPIVGESDRAALLQYLKPVSHTFIVDEDNCLPLIKRLRPEVFYTLKDDWGRGGVRRKVEEQFVKSYGGRVIKVPKELPYLSSSEMVERVADLKIKQVIEYFMGQVDLKPYSGKKSQALYFNPKAHEAVLSFSKPNIPANLLSLAYFGREVGFSNLADLGDNLRGSKRKIVLTAIGGDLIHIGHAKFLEKAKSLGDILVVGIPSNESMRRQKGAGRPIIDEKARAEILCYLKPVDYVVIFPQDTVLEAVLSLKPHIFQTVKDDWNRGYRRSPEYRAVLSYGGKVVRIEKQAQGMSATQLINKAAGIRVRQMFRECLGENVKAQNPNVKKISNA